MIVFEWSTHKKLTVSGDNTIKSAIFLCLLSPTNRVTDRVLLVTYLKTLSDGDPHALPPGAFVPERPSSLTLSRPCESDEDGWLPITLAVLEIQDCMQAMPPGMEICFSFFLFPDTHARLRGDYEHVSRLQGIPSSTNIKSKTIHMRGKHRPCIPRGKDRKCFKGESARLRHGLQLPHSAVEADWGEKSLDR